MQLKFSGSLFGGPSSSVDVILTAAASDHVEDSADSHAAPNYRAYPDVELGESE